MESEQTFTLLWNPTVSIILTLLLNSIFVSDFWKLTQSPALAAINNSLTMWKHYLLNTEQYVKHNIVHVAIVLQ